jgi:hypothetical protein
VRTTARVTNSHFDAAHAWLATRAMMSGDPGNAAEVRTGCPQHVGRYLVKLQR